MTNAIEVEHLTKRYRLGETHSNTFREAVTGRLKRAKNGENRDAPEEVVSLRDVTFSVREGEAVGVIGRNGAGKSTLLKVLSRITEPTEGVSRTRGRVGSLLEVGTGFHPELTGRENVYLNGVILGMSRRDVNRRFDEIVEFSGVGRFLDTPIKRYSSGMQLRLAFAVAAHLEPAIMVVDEVLAVGDAEFRRKCLGKMRDVEQQGRTVVFVSHDMDAIARLCARVIWLERGEIRVDGPTSATMDAYLAEATAAHHRIPPGGVAAGPLRIHDVKVLDPIGTPVEALRRELPFTVEIDYELAEPVPGFDIAVTVASRRGTRILDELLSDSMPDGRGERGRFVARLTIPPVLNGGDYELGVWFGTAYEDLWMDLNIVQLRLEGGPPGRGERAVCLDLPWDVQRTGATEPARRGAGNGFSA